MRLLFASPPVPITDSLPTILSSRRFSRLMPSCISEHGSLEVAWKQVGMSGNCYPDRLIGSLPSAYLYAANNPSEATIANVFVRRYRVLLDSSC
jgi:hypothetical protein